MEMPGRVRRWHGAVQIQAGRTGNVGQSKFISEAMLWKCQAGYAGGVGQSGFRRGALATWSVEIQF